MTILELKSEFKRSLEEIYPSEEIQSFFYIIAENYLALSRIEIALKPDFNVLLKDVERIHEAILRLKKFEPIQYIIGETEFYGLTFKVNTHTLIPRPETEELVEWIVSKQVSAIHRDNSLSILDIGTGSGCIAISLAKNIENSEVHALDISLDAIKMARENAELNEAAVDFFQTDILKATTLPSSVKYDIIVSNPPYVLELEKSNMQPNVLDYEPATALFVENKDPLLFYKAISKLAKTSLKSHGHLFFEINEQFGKELELCLKQDGFKNIELRKDIFGKDRMIKCEI